MNAQKFKDAWKALDVEYSQFIRTTDEQHEKVVQKYLKNSLKKATSISTLTKDYIVPAAKLS